MRSVSPSGSRALRSSKRRSTACSRLSRRLRQFLQDRQRPLEKARSIPVCVKRVRFGARALQVVKRLIPDAAFFRVVGQPFDVLIEASLHERFERASGARMQRRSSFSQQAGIGHLARHRVLEGIFGFREKRFFVQELCDLQIAELPAGARNARFRSQPPGAPP